MMILGRRDLSSSRGILCPSLCALLCACSGAPSGSAGSEGASSTGETTSSSQGSSSGSSSSSGSTGTSSTESDSGCSGSSGCEGDGEGSFPGQCEDQVDNDGDRLVDCEDPDCSDQPPCAGRLELGIPAYFYPGPEWAQATASASAFGVMIANPYNGPGEQLDANYTDVIENAQGAGIQIYGYVYTGYGERPDAEVRADIDRWYGFYPTIDGIFFDEVAGSATCALQEPSYLGWSDHVRTHPGAAEVALNPGTSTCESYLEFADSVMIFEDDLDHFMSWSPPEWVKNHKPSRFWVLVLEAPAASLDAVLMRTRDAGVARVYVTDDGGSNPWDTLSSYWTELVAGVTS